ncbi:MAG: hypothetical protein ACUVSU_07025 [Aggregatilineaceae bacterium]
MARSMNPRNKTQLAPRPQEAPWGTAFAEPQAWALQWDGYALQANNSRSASSSVPGQLGNGPAR